MKRLPLAVYLVIYTATCLLGAIGLLASPALVGLAQLFTGADAFLLSSRDVFYNILLLAVGPVLLIVGYELALRVHAEVVSAAPGQVRNPALGAVVPWLVSIASAFLSLSRGSAFSNLGAWRSYGDWVKARWQLFDTLGFLEFVNLYIIVPVTTAFVVLWILRRGGSWLRRSVLVIASMLPMIAADLLLYQKKTLLVSVILVALAVLIDQGYAAKAVSRRVLRPLATLGIATYLVYCLLIARPAISTRAKAMAGQPSWLTAESSPSTPSGHAPAPSAESAETRVTAGVAAHLSTRLTDDSAVTIGATGRPLAVDSPRGRRLRFLTERLFPARWIGIPPGSEQGLPNLSRGPALALYVLLGPVTRTPLPALIYPSVFPERTPFYGLDVGLDFLGVGRMPTDNILVHKMLWPRIEGGSIMVPFQYAFFSQVGLGGALFLSVLVGYGLALCWMLVAFRGRSAARAVGGALILILAVYLAGDSLRNGLLASYGIFWGAIYLCLWSWLSARVAARPDAAGR